MMRVIEISETARWPDLAEVPIEAVVTGSIAACSKPSVMAMKPEGIVMARVKTATTAVMVRVRGTEVLRSLAPAGLPEGQSLEPDDLLMAHIGGMDICARGLKAAARMLEDGVLTDFVRQRYAGWDDKGAEAMLNGERTLDQIAEWVKAQDINPEPNSGRQEMLENIVNRYV